MAIRFLVITVKLQNTLKWLRVVKIKEHYQNVSLRKKLECRNPWPHLTTILFRIQSVECNFILIRLRIMCTAYFERIRLYIFHGIIITICVAAALNKFIKSEWLRFGTSHLHHGWCPTRICSSCHYVPILFLSLTFSIELRQSFREHMGRQFVL